MIPDALNSCILAGRAGPLRMVSKVVKPEPEPEPSFAWRTFVMTAGNSGEWDGFSDGDIAVPPFNPPVGMISQSPAPDVELYALYEEPGRFSLIALFSDNVEQVAPLMKAAIHDVELSYLTHSRAVGRLMVEFSGPALVTFTDGLEYEITFSQVEA